MTTPTLTETTTSNIPSWAIEPATKLLGFGAALTFPKQKIDPTTGQPVVDAQGKPVLESGFTPYAGQLVAGLSPLQKQAMGDLSQMQVSPQIGQATGLTGLAALQAQDLASYNPMQQQQFYRSPFERPGNIQRYMSPYMQNVVDVQKQQAVQDYARQIPGLQAQGIRAGARGGTREALLQSEANRNLQNQLQGIQATGVQNAYQQAAQQAAQDAQMRAQYGYYGSQLGEQSRQFGAGLGLQGLQQQLSAAKQLSDIGQQQYQQGLGITGAQLGAGQQAQNTLQQMLTSNYQRFIDEQQYPYKQLEFFSNLLRGIPSTASTSALYTPGSNLTTSVGSLTGGLGGLFGSFGGG